MNTRIVNASVWKYLPSTRPGGTLLGATCATDFQRMRLIEGQSPFSARTRIVVAVVKID
jgi:hypothetical protein